MASVSKEKFEDEMVEREKISFEHLQCDNQLHVKLFKKLFAVVYFLVMLTELLSKITTGALFEHM